MPPILTLVSRPLAALTVLVLLLVAVSACDTGYTEPSLDAQLREALEIAAEGQGVAYFRLPPSTDLAAIPQDPRNPLTPEKVALGRLLFHETALAVNARQPSGMGTYACASCHHPGAGFMSGIRQGIADGGIGFGVAGEARRPSPDYPADMPDMLPIRPPTVLNTAWQEVVLWNGQFGATGPNVGTESEWLEGTPLATNRLGYMGQETQAIAGLSVHRMGDGAPQMAVAYPEYRALFDAVFADRPGLDRVTTETAGLAIAAYVRTLTTTEAPFQRWLRGETDAMNEAEKRGALLFFGRANCVACHTGPALSSMSFHALGMGELMGPGVFSPFNPKDPVHLGRASFTARDEDRFQFKTPPLYNLADAPFLGHGSTFTSLREVVDYKNAARPQSSLVPADRLSPLFQPLQLSAQDVDDLVAFLERALHDPTVGRYVPDAVPSGNCFPMNDAQSRIDLGCE